MIFYNSHPNIQTFLGIPFSYLNASDLVEITSIVAELQNRIKRFNNEIH
jgi:hypothetical protein